MTIKKEILFRVGLVYFCFALLALAIVARIVYIQFVQGEELRNKIKTKTLKDITIEPNRGNILATDGRILATSIPSYEISMDMQASGLDEKTFLDNVDSLAICLSKLFRDKPASVYKRELKRAYTTKTRFHLVKRRVDYLDLKTLKSFPLYRLGRNSSGMVPKQENVRFQPHKTLASRTIGYITKGKTMVGLEGRYNKELQGLQGIRMMQYFIGGNWMPVSDQNEVEPKDGYDIISTIDVNIQDVAEHALRKQLEKHNAHHGCAILMEVKTGEIKAIANLGKDEKGNYTENFNYAIGESSEPGSTFKLASIIAALEDGYVQPEDTVDTKNGIISYHGKDLSDHEGKGWGKISIEKAFEYSSNVGISYIINKYYYKKPKQFVDHLYAMKLNTPLGLDIQGEGKPEIKYPGDKYWSKISIPMMSIGYEVRLTPIHTLTFYNAIANDGKMVKPHFVKALSYHGNIIRNFDTEVIESSICSHSTLKKVRKMLEGVVENGTAKNLKNENYRIAGKTGTAQIAKQRSGYRTGSGTSYQASFAGYFPADNPIYSCIVVVNSPLKGGYYGNVVAGNVFKEISDKVFATSLEIQPLLKHKKLMADVPYSKTGIRKDLDYIFNKLDIAIEDNDVESDWVSTERKDEQIEFKQRKVIESLVPNVVDMGLKDAIYLLENAGLKVIVRGYGKVVKQSVRPGVKARPGNTIVLEMSLG
jgi:cell division protein FtsI (penicillin-binding protein 3)